MTQLPRNLWARRLAEIVGLASAYAVAGRLSLLLALPPGYATAIWPPAGLALAGALILGRQVWPGIFLGSFLVNVETSFDASSTSTLLRSIVLPCGIAAGAALQAVVGAALVRRFTNIKAVLRSERSVLRFLLLGGPLSCLVNASISIASLALAGAISAGEIPFSWWTWWVGDSIGVLVFAPLGLLWAPQVGPVVRRRRIWVSVPLCCTFVLVVLIFLRASAAERTRIDLELQHRVDRLAHALTRRLDGSLEILGSLNGVFASLPEGGRSDIREYARRLLARHPEVQALCWGRYVRRAERVGHELTMPRNGQPRFEIKERDALDGVVPECDEHVALHFLQPEAEDVLALGFDEASDPRRAATLRRAGDTGEPSATGFLDPVLETGGAPGVLFVQPVYVGGVVPDSVEERRLRLEGFAIGTLSTDRLLSAVLQDAELEGFDLRLWDVSTEGLPQPLGRGLPASHGPRDDRDLRADERAVGSRTAGLRIADRRWMLELVPSPSSLAASGSWHAWGFHAGGLVFTGLLGAFLLIVTGRTVLVEEIVAKRTDELRHTNETLRREVAERIVAQKIASIDPLTELLNRRGLEAELSTEVHRARRTGSTLAAVLLDLDDFKRINETLGHAVGDIVLREVAARLTGALRPTDHLARIGGDEFLVLLPDTRLAEAAHVAERLRLSVADSPLRLASGPVRLTSSLGLERVPTNVVSVEEVLAKCQQSLQRSKKAGKNRVSARGARNVLRGPSLRGIVDELLRPSSFRAVKHAILSLPDEKVVGWEFLSRGPSGSFEMPGDFFRLALERNVLTLVDLHCLRACVEAARELPEATRCHVNLFPSTLLDTPEEQLVELFPCEPSGPRYCVEVSEQQFIGDPACLRGPVDALKSAGIQVAIDDVGFGRSSLESLILLEPDLVKLDQQVVRGAAQDPGKERSLRRLVDVVSATKSGIVAEGIESREDLELLRAVGVPHGQGFLWGQPA